MEENPNRQIKIYCPKHQSVFEVAEKPQIICEIREHALSSNFPRAEFWEYCCDCRTFSPSVFGTGVKAADACPHCERSTLRRFFCDECSILSYDSGEDTKGKQFTVSLEKGAEPTCPGCQKSFGAAKPLLHNCADIEDVLFTHREVCPLCQKPVIEKHVPPVETGAATTKLDAESGSTQCPGCGHWGIASRNHCGKCGLQINALGADVSAGSSTPRTQLLGSICPNCGAANPSGSSFCPNCGQALKTSQQAGVGYTSQQPNFTAHPLPSQANQPTASFPAGQTSAFNIPPPAPAPPKSKMPLFIIGGAFATFVIVLIAISAGKPDANANYTNYNVGTNNTNRATPTRTPANSSSPTPTSTTNTNSSSPFIGRKGRLTTDLNIRASSGKYSEVIGTHYKGAQVEILDVEYFTQDGENVIWYRVEVLENGYDKYNSKGNNWERNGDFGWMNAEMEGWMNAKYIRLE